MSKVIQVIMVKIRNRLKTLVFKLQREIFKLKRFHYIAKMKKEVINKDFSIICSNCFAGRIYKDMDMKYTSPTISLYFFSDDYIKFLSDIENNIHAELSFRDVSKYELGNERRIFHKYPIGVINNDIEIHFMHSNDPLEAKKIWDRRSKRVNLDNLYIIAMEQNLTTEKEVIEFDRLPFKNKIFFTAKKYDTESSVYMPSFEKNGIIGDGYNFPNIFYKSFDFIKWFNTK